MKKARIIDGGWLYGVYDVNWLKNNENNVVDGIKVKKWVLIDDLPTNNLIKPFWNGLSWEEGATQDEQDEYNNFKEEQEDIIENEIEEKDAIKFIKQYKQRLRRKVKKGQLTKKQAKRIKYDLKDVWLFMMIGFWDVAKDVLIGIADYNNQSLQTELDFLRTRIGNYQEQRKA